jgi:hypothetical protein
MNFTDLLKSKTVWGVIIAVLGFLSQPQVLALLPEKVGAIIIAIGTVLGAFGIRAAIAKSGPTG